MSNNVQVNDITDEWGTSSGLPLSDIDAEIIAASFGYNAKIGADALCLNVTFQEVDGSGDAIEQSFSVGKDWEAVENGDWIVDARGNAKRKVAGGSNYGILIDSAVAAINKAGATPPFQSPRNASGWVGTRWHVGSVKVEREDQKSREKKAKDVFVFTDYLGTGKGETKKASSSTPAKTNTAASTGDGGDELDAKLRRKLVAAAAEADSFDDFQEKVWNIDGVEGNKLAEKLVIKKGPGSIWAEGQAAKDED